MDRAAPKIFDRRGFTKGLIVVLESAYLEVAKVGNDYQLLNTDEHTQFLLKKKRDPTQNRPDIVHQCLMTLLDSPLNKAGLLKIYIHTANNMLIDVNPKLRIPRTYKRFAGLMVQLFHKLSIKAEGKHGETVLKLIKNPITDHLPLGARCISTSYSSKILVDIVDYVPTLFSADGSFVNLANQKLVSSADYATATSTSTSSSSDNTNSKRKKTEDDDEDEQPKLKKIKKEVVASDDEDEEKEDDDDDDEEEAEVKEEDDEEDEDGENENSDEEGVLEGAVAKEKDKVMVFAIGAMSHGRIDTPWCDTDISYSQYPLSGSVACGKLCCAFEKYYGIV